MAQQPGYAGDGAGYIPAQHPQQQQQQQQSPAQANQAYYQAFSGQPAAHSSAAPTEPQPQHSYQPYHAPQQTAGEANQAYQQQLGAQGGQYYPPPPPGPPPQQQSGSTAGHYYPPPPPPGSAPPQQQNDQAYAPPAAGIAAYPSSAGVTGYAPQAGGAPTAHPGVEGASAGAGAVPYPGAAAAAGSNTAYKPPPPPRRKQHDYGDDDPSNPIHYTRDPHKLVAYLVPFPKPQLRGVDPATVPDRFLIYTPPPPPLSRPGEGEKEDKLHKVQRKWQEELREAKTSTAKTASWKGVKSKATKGIDWAMNKTTGSNLDFLNRIPGSSAPSSSTSPGATTAPAHGDNNHAQGGQPTAGTPAPGPAFEQPPKKTVGLEEMVLVYPASMPGSQAELRAEFVNSMLRSKSKAQRDSVIATGLLPVSFAVDVLATLVWPFGGLLEIDAVWLYSSVRGAKTARATTKRLESTTATTTTAAGGEGAAAEPQLRLTFAPSRRLETLRTYLAADCHRLDRALFPHAGVTAPTETQVLEAIGWAPSQTGGETRNWEDEQWEAQETKEDTKRTFAKGAAEWVKWCKAWEKDPVKAAKK